MKNPEKFRATGFDVEGSERPRVDAQSGEILGEPTITYGELLTALQGLNAQQLDQPVTFWGETQNGRIAALEVLEDDYVYDGYEGYWPKTEYCEDMTPEEREDVDLEHHLPKGTVKLQVVE